LGFGFWVLGFGFGVLGFGLWVSGFRVELWVPERGFDDRVLGVGV
jgi:hypothetical protein